MAPLDVCAEAAKLVAPTYHGQVDVPKDVVAVANVDEDDREHHSDPHDGVDWENEATGGSAACHSSLS